MQGESGCIKLVTDKVKALLSTRGKKNIELAKYTNQHLRNIIIRKRQGNNNIVNLYKTVREAALFGADLVKSKSIEIYSKKIYANKERFKIQGAGVMALTAICPYAQT